MRLSFAVVLTSALAVATAEGAAGPPTHLTFTRCCGKDTGGYIVQLDGGRERNIADWAPAWSPDGRRVVAAFRIGPGRPITQVVDLQTGKRTTLRNVNRTGRWDWSPDGKQLAYSSGEKIWVAAADGRSKPRQITNGLNDTGPAWSPDGGRILYRSLEPAADPRFGTVGRIVTIRPDGSDRQLLVPPAVDWDQTHGADWSPDGKQIVFESTRDDPYGFNNGELYVMNIDGSNVRRLTSSAGWDGHPEWSPDGSKIAFVSRRDGGKGDLYVMDADGSNQRRVALAASSPQWVPRGAKTTIPKARRP